MNPSSTETYGPGAAVTERFTGAVTERLPIGPVELETPAFGAQYTMRTLSTAIPQ